MTCSRTITYNDGLGRNYSTCGKVAKFKYSYVFNGKKESECVCGIHAQSLKKWAARLKKKHNINVDYIEEKL